MDVVQGTARRWPAEAVARVGAGSRLLFVDNIRVFLTMLVIMHHLLITYAGSGSWYYMETPEDIATIAVGSWVLSVDQAFFMGLFLFIAAYFVPGSYDRKGAGRFLKDRLIRLGIPLAVYSWVVAPLFAYALKGATQGVWEPFWSFLPGEYLRDNPWIGNGPLWFIETLLIFSLVYAAWRFLFRAREDKPAAESRFPGNLAIALAALILGVMGFGVRLWRPMGWNWQPWNLQLPFFVLYIAMFVAGLIAYRRNWLAALPDRQGRLWLGAAVVLIVIFLPMGVAGGALENGGQPFGGGWHWQALMFALWESFLCLAMCIGLVYLFRRYANHQGKLAALFSRSAYGAYLIHGPIIVIAAYAARDVALYPLLKWAVVGLVAVPVCFLVGYLMRKLPYADRVL